MSSSMEPDLCRLLPLEEVLGSVLLMPVLDGFRS